MALPPWTVELLRRGVADLARQATDPDVVQSLKVQTARMVEELPRVAREKVDSILQSAQWGTAPLRAAWSSATTPMPPSGLINATGRLDDPAGTGVALAPEVLFAGSKILASEFRMEASRIDAIRSEIAAAVSVEAGCEVEMAVTGSLRSAISLLVPLSRRGSCLLVPRCCAKPIAALEGAMLADALKQSGAGSLREIGGIDGWGPSQIAASMDPGKKSNWLARLSDSVPAEQSSTFREHGIGNVVVMPSGRLVTSPTQTRMTDTAAAQIRGGADIVVLGGGVWTGTPELGYLIARPDAMAMLRDSSRFASSMAPAAYFAIAEAAVRLSATTGLPIDHLMAASIDNLGDRAERLATQIGGIAGFRDVRVTDRDAEVAATAIPSRQVVWTTENAASLRSRYRGGDPVVLVGGTDDVVELDLRWVTPDQQAKLGQWIAAGV